MEPVGNNPSLSCAFSLSHNRYGGAAKAARTQTQRRIPADVCQNQAWVALPSAATLGHACELPTARTPLPIIRPSLQTPDCSSVVASRVEKRSLPSLGRPPPPSLNEHSWLLTRFYRGSKDNILDYNTICCARGEQLLKAGSLTESVISSLIPVLLQRPSWLSDASFVAKHHAAMREKQTCI